MNKQALVFGAGLLMLGGCPLLDVEVEVPEVCVSYHDLHVDGVDAPVDGAVTISKSFAVDDLGAFHQVTDRDADISFVRADLLALSGVDNFDFVQAARITIRSGDEGSSLPPLVLYQCDGDCVPADGTLDMTAANQHDAVDYLKGDSLIIDVELTGTVPRQEWSMDVDVCFAGRAGYQY